MRDPACPESRAIYERLRATPLTEQVDLFKATAWAGGESRERGAGRAGARHEAEASTYRRSAIT
jgi:hypothetical protein